MSSHSSARRAGMRWVRVVLSAALVLGAAACTALPSSGPVHQVQVHQAELSAVDVVYSGPAADASPTQIVEGFLAASSSGYSDDFATAHLYLTPRAARDWKPQAGTVVVDAALPAKVKEREPGTIDVTTTVRAEVDTNGRYSVKPSPVEDVREFALTQDDAGQWRIDQLPDGLAVADVTFENIFDRVNLRFLSPDKRVLVPETRWFPRQVAAAKATQALLYGPSSWLAPAVVSAIPPHTTVERQVSDSDGTASVQLRTPQPLDADSAHLLLAQVQRTLADIPGVEAVALQLNGVPVAPTGSGPAAADIPPDNGAPLLATANGLARWNGRELLTLEGSSAGMTGPAESGDGVLAVDGGGNVVAVGPQAPPRVLAEGPGLVNPEPDPWGWGLTGLRDNPGQLIAVKGETTTAVPAPWLQGQQVLRVTLAPDGTQLQVVSQTGNIRMVRVATLVRDETGMPVSVTDPIDVPLLQARALDADWVGMNQLAVLAQDSDGSAPRVIITSVGQPVFSLPPVSGGAQVAGGSSDRSVVVVTAEGVLYVRAGAGWREAAKGVFDPNTGR